MGFWDKFNEMQNLRNQVRQAARDSRSWRPEDLTGKYLNGNAGERMVSRYIHDKKYGIKLDSNHNQKGCFITTAVCDSFAKPDDCYELNQFRQFRDGWLMKQSDGKQLIDEYYTIAPQIVETIDSLSDAPEIYHDLWDKYLHPCLNYIEAGDNQSCKALYITMVHNLKSQYINDR